MIPREQKPFLSLVADLFPRPDLSGVVVRIITPPDSAAIALVYIADLIGAADLERLVLTPLSQGGISGPPEALMRSGRFPASQLRCGAEARDLTAGLLAGLAAIHVDGHPGILLVGSDLRESPDAGFGPDLEGRIATLCRQLRRPDLHTERLVRADGSRAAILYLKSKAPPALVRSVRTWSLDLSGHPGPVPWYRNFLNAIRLPPAVESPSPAAVAESLTRGYVAVLRDDRSEPLLAPTTLELLFRGPRDVALLPAARRVVLWPRLVAALLGLTLSASLVAVSAYHHTLMPGPFLVAMATSRSNLPFPVVGEMILVSLISDTVESAVIRTGGRRLLVLAYLGNLLAFMAMMQVGVLGAVSGVVGIVESAIRAALPNLVLQRIVRLWRYFFIGAAAGLGVTGITLLFFALMIYVAEEQALEHPVRLPPAGVM
ncbi:MAG: spore germination protein [Bacillota bacterium]